MIGSILEKDTKPRNSHLLCVERDSKKIYTGGGGLHMSETLSKRHINTPPSLCIACAMIHA